MALPDHGEARERTTPAAGAHAGNEQAVGTQVTLGAAASTTTAASAPERHITVLITRGGRNV